MKKFTHPSRPKTQVEQFIELMKTIDKPKVRYSFDALGKLLYVHTDHVTLKNWLQAKGFT